MTRGQNRVNQPPTRIIKVRKAIRLKEYTMTAITVTLPADVIRRIDELRQIELLSRSNWLRREVVLAVRESIATDRESRSEAPLGPVN